jgi:thiamine pyrophosphokinase
MGFTGGMPGVRILGVLAGNDTPIQTVAAWAASADLVIAADGAANQLLEAGISISAIIGDMDSIDPVVERSKIEFLEDPDQETTDCDKLLVHVRDRYPDSSFALAGIEGDRFDHVFSSIFSVGRILPSTRLILRDGFGWYVQSESGLDIATVPGQLVSLIPLLPCEGVRMLGVRWSPSSILAPLGDLSTSNEATGDRVQVTLKSGAALLIQQAPSYRVEWL